MALTSSDETDLLIPLHDGSLGEQRFPLFLARLRERTRAARASLLITDGAGPPRLFAATTRSSGSEPVTSATHLAEGLSAQALRPSRVYTLEELLGPRGVIRAAFAGPAPFPGTADERVVRVAPASGVSAWLTIARTEPCSAADSALLSALAPHLGVSVRNEVLARQERMIKALDRAGLARSATGWIALAADARVVACDPVTAQRIERATGHAPREGERLGGGEPAVERRLVELVARLSSSAEAGAAAVVLSAEPRIELVVDRAERTCPGLAEIAPVVALARYAPEGRSRSPDVLAELLAVSTREAELALRISEGLSIKEAATRMGLTEETARTYSKQLYAKLSLRGQAELVRLVCDSAAGLA